MSPLTPAAIVARLDYIERALFGTTLTVQSPEPPALAPEPHACIPAIVEPDVAKATATAINALGKLIEDESQNLRLLRKLKQVLVTIEKDQSVLNDEIRQELSAGYNAINCRYGSGGQTIEMERLGYIGEDASEPIGTLSGDLIPLSDGAHTSAEYGHVRAYLIGKDIQEAIARNTCELCMPNFQAMIDADIARGLIRANNDRYEVAGQ